METNDNIYSYLDKLKSFNYLGEKKMEDGTLLIGKAPHIAPLAWLHCIYAPLVDKDILYLEKQLKHSIPKSYKFFLKVTNGLNIFNTTLSLYGLRKNYERDITEVWQPFDIITPNLFEIPTNAQNEILIIGSYDWDGSYLYIGNKSEKVFLCERENITPRFEWENLYEMLNSEISRLIKLYDEKGKEIDINKSTLPFSS